MCKIYSANICKLQTHPEGCITARLFTQSAGKFLWVSQKNVPVIRQTTAQGDRANKWFKIISLQSTEIKQTV